MADTKVVYEHLQELHRLYGNQYTSLEIKTVYFNAMQKWYDKHLMRDDNFNNYVKTILNE